MSLLPLWISTITVAHVVGCCIFLYAYINASNLLGKRTSQRELKPQTGLLKVRTDSVTTVVAVHEKTVCIVPLRLQGIISVLAEVD